jgi:hypothetical protein
MVGFSNGAWFRGTSPLVQIAARMYTVTSNKPMGAMGAEASQELVSDDGGFSFGDVAETDPPHPYERCLRADAKSKYEDLSEVDADELIEDVALEHFHLDAYRALPLHLRKFYRVVDYFLGIAPDKYCFKLPDMRGYWYTEKSFFAPKRLSSEPAPQFKRIYMDFGKVIWAGLMGSVTAVAHDTYAGKQYIVKYLPMNSPYRVMEVATELMYTCVASVRELGAELVDFWYCDDYDSNPELYVDMPDILETPCVFMLMEKLPGVPLQHIKSYRPEFREFVSRKQELMGLAHPDQAHCNIMVLDENDVTQTKLIDWNPYNGLFRMALIDDVPPPSDHERKDIEQFEEKDAEDMDIH